jgi:large subunit ribosomal protein L15
MAKKQEQEPQFERVTLSNLSPAPGSRQARKRLGRGPGSGLGKTSGKGHKGHKARAGGSTNPGFEGGQTPLYRRLPKRGFTNPFKVTYLALNLRDLDRVKGDVISPETLVAAGKLKKASDPVKLLGHGKVSRALTVQGLPVSAQARAKIEAAGGKVEA